LLLVGVGGFFFMKNRELKKDAQVALGIANDELEQADQNHVKALAGPEYQKAVEALDQAKAQVDAGDWENGTATATQAKKLMLAAEAKARENKEAHDKAVAEAALAAEREKTEKM